MIILTKELNIFLYLPWVPEPQTEWKENWEEV